MEKDNTVTIYRGTYGVNEHPVIYINQPNNSQEYFYEITSDSVFKGNAVELKLIEKIQRFQEAGFNIEFKKFIKFEECPGCEEEKLSIQNEENFIAKHCFNCGYDDLLTP